MGCQPTEGRYLSLEQDETSNQDEALEQHESDDVKDEAERCNHAAGAEAQDLVRRYGLFETLDRDPFYPTLEAAMAAIGEA